MLKRLLQARFLIIIIVLFTIINATVFIGLGVYFSIEGILGILRGEVHSEVYPGLSILESLDLFLVALVFLIFAIGITSLFLYNTDEKDSIKLPEWLHIKTFSELKLLLWETILTTLVVYFISAVVRLDGHYTWELLILPFSILLLSLSVFILKK